MPRRAATRYVALLHAVNLGRNNKVPMARLRELAVDAGYDEVATHLASGNLLLATTQSATTVERTVADVVARGLGLDVEITVRSAAALGAAVEADPLGAVATDPSRHAVVFCHRAPAAAAVAACVDDAAGPDRLGFDGTDVHLWAPAGFAETPWTKAVLQRRLGVPVTVRNWRTVEALRQRLTAAAG